MRVLFDATTALEWASRPAVGTVRVERLILGELCRRLPAGDLLLIKFRAGRFVPLRPAQAAVVRDVALGDSAPPADAPRRRQRPWRRWLKARSRPEPPDLAGFTDLVTLGHGWDYLGHDELARLRAAHGLRLHGFVHDLIAVEQPHFYHEPARADRLRGHHAELCRLADVLVVNSRATRASLERFIAREGLPRPELHVATLPSCIGGGDAAALPPVVGDAPFVLYVSTLEIRKNHRLLLRLWSESARGGRDLPRLVLVGRVGWGVEEALRMLQHDPALQGRVVLLENLPDAELASLYRGCLFTLYPSYVEGWGMPIAEAMALGKVCLHADDPAQREAAQGLSPCCHPDDHVAWRAEIASLAFDAGRRAELEARIRAGYRTRTAGAFCADVAAAIGLP